MGSPLKLLSIGCGNMGAAILSGVLARQPDAQIVAVDPAIDRARSLLPEAGAISVVASLQELGAFRPDMTILAIKPQHFQDLAAKGALAAVVQGGTVVSIMAGIGSGAIEECLPGAAVVRVMPNLPALVGQGMTVGYGASDLTSNARCQVEDVFRSVGDFQWLEQEAQIDLCTAVAGSGPGYIFAVAHHFEQAACAAGLSASDARRLVRQVLLGSAILLGQETRSALDLKAAVTSQGGTTAAGLAILEQEVGLAPLFREAVAAAHARAIELSAG